MSDDAGAIAYEGPKFSFVDVGITIIVAVFIGVITYNFVNEEIDSYSLQAKSVERVLIYSCLAYSDDFGKHPGIIDVSKLTPEILQSCYSKDGLGYKVKLFDLNNNLIKEFDPDFRINSFIPICSSVTGFKCFDNKEYVLFLKDGNMQSGVLNVEVISSAK